MRRDQATKFFPGSRLDTELGFGAGMGLSNIKSCAHNINLVSAAGISLNYFLKCGKTFSFNRRSGSATRRGSLRAMCAASEYVGRAHDPPGSVGLARER